MIDKVKIFAKAGDGGHGCTSSRRSRHDRKSIADGAFSSSFFIMFYLLDLTYAGDQVAQLV